MAILIGLAVIGAVLSLIQYLRMRKKLDSFQIWSQLPASVRIELQMSLTKTAALEMFESDDLIGIGMEADAVRRQLHPEGTVNYIIDRNINYTNFCTEYCTFCAFYAR